MAIRLSTAAITILAAMMILTAAATAAQLGNRACEEIYVVGDGETLNTISEKCGDPFIVEENPHIHDPDDVFPGLVIKITPFRAF
ncbi:hypothetical protein LINPERPRIM_LOCUS12813 [Linum perenne]